MSTHLLVNSHIIFRFLLATLSFGGAEPAFSNEDGVHIDCVDSGVWVGQIDKKPVTLDFSNGGGRYYYGVNLQDLVLERDVSQSNRWLEFDMQGARTGTMELNCGKSMHGKWISVDKSKEFEVNASSFILKKTEKSNDSEIDDEVIESDSYLDARLSALPETRKKKAFFDGHEYLILERRGLSTTGVEFRGNNFGTFAINEKLRDDFNSNVNGAVNCAYWWLVLGGSEHSIPFTARQKVVFWRGSNVIVTSETAYCIGNFISGGRRAMLFNTRTGSNENGWGPWLEKRYETGTFDSPLIEMLVPYYSASQQGKLPQCANFLKEKTQIIVWPEQHGMALDISAVPGFTNKEENNFRTDCKAILSVPYSMVTPFLSDVGKEKLKTLLSPK